MALTSTQKCEPKSHLREGAIYSDSSNNIIRLLSIHADYCVYVYVALANHRPEMHGSVTGLTRRDAFEAGFILVAVCLEEWNGGQRRSADRRVQALPILSSLGSFDFASVSVPQEGNS
jgi:hypothetical protein